MDKMRRYVSKYLGLLRPKILVLFIFPLTLGFAASVDYVNGLEGWRIACAYLSFVCGSFFGSTLNFFSDVEADKLHTDLYKDLPLSEQPFATGEMGKVETPLVFAVSAMGCIGFGLLTGFWFAVFMVSATMLLGVLYSHPWFQWKAKPVLDVLCNSAGPAVILIAGWNISRPADIWPPLLPALFGALLAMNIYLPTVGNDIPFDEAAGYRTSGVVFGAKRLVDAMIPVCVIMAVVAVLILVGDYQWQFKLFAAGGLPAMIAYTVTIRVLFKPPQAEFNPGLLVYPVTALTLFYFVYALSTALT